MTTTVRDLICKKSWFIGKYVKDVILYIIEKVSNMQKLKKIISNYMKMY